MTPSTIEIWGRRTMNSISAMDYIEWAGEMLVAGYDSYSLRILAGLHRQSSCSEVEDYFLHTIKELQLPIPSAETAIRAFACELAEKIIKGEIAINIGVRAMYQFCLTSNYHQDFCVWLDLDDALDSLLIGDHPYTYETATTYNFESIVQMEAERFIALMKEKGIDSAKQS